MKSEQQLIEESKRGDGHSYAQLMETHQDLVYHLVLQMVPSEAEDLVQEIFMKAYHNLPKFRGESSFKTWLVRLAINHCKNHQRKMKVRQTALQSLLWETKGATPVSTTSSFDASETVHIQASLQKLAYRHREVVVLHDVLGFKYSEIGEMLNLSLGTVKSRLYYARSALRRHLTEKSSEGM